MSNKHSSIANVRERTHLLLAAKAVQHPNPADSDQRFEADPDRAAGLYDEMRQYENEPLLEKIGANLELPAEAARELFEDVKKFIALCSSMPKPLSPPRIVDQAWHEFILFTKDYAKFCNHYCGRYIHHQPSTSKDQATDYTGARRQTRELAEAAYRTLSANWNESQTASKCTHNCGTGDVGRLHDD